MTFPDEAAIRADALRKAADIIEGSEPKHFNDLDVDPEDYGTGAEYGMDCAAWVLRDMANQMTAREE